MAGELVRLGGNMRRVRIRTRGPRSLRTVSKAIREDHSVVSRWERGELEMKVSDLIRYAAACGVEPHKLLAGVTQRPPEQLVLGLQPEVGRRVLWLVDELRRRCPPYARGRRTA